MAFLLEAFTNPQKTGAVAPSSKRLARLFARHADLASAKVVVELGPGTGALTGEIEKALGDGTEFFTLELNPAFAEVMRRRFPTVRTITGSAAELSQHLAELGHKTCDRVVCGLPWTAFPPTLQEEILTDVVKSLAPGGLFLTFAYSLLNLLPRGRNFRAMLRKHFSSVVLTETVLNLPPAFVYVCRK